MVLVLVCVCQQGVLGRELLVYNLSYLMRITNSMKMRRTPSNPHGHDGHDGHPFLGTWKKINNATRCDRESTRSKRAAKRNATNALLIQQIRAAHERELRWCASAS